MCGKPFRELVGVRAGARAVGPRVRRGIGVEQRAEAVTEGRGHIGPEVSNDSPPFRPQRVGLDRKAFRVEPGRGIGAREQRPQQLGLRGGEPFARAHR